MIIKKRLGEILCEAGVVTPEQIEYCIKKQKGTNKRLGETLLDEKIITEFEMLRALEKQLGIPYIELEKMEIDQTIAARIPENIARRHTVVAIGIENGYLQVAMRDPLDIYAIEDIEIATKMEVEPALATKSSLLSALSQIYASAKTDDIVSEVEKQIQEEIQSKANVEDESQDATDENAPMILLVNNILERCIIKGASDLHIEPFENYVRIRYRVDGQLHLLTKTNKQTLNVMTTRIKILSGLDIAERRLPQDGRMSRNVDGQLVDMRVSILPTIFGEKTVIRFIYRTGRQFTLDDLGFQPDDYIKIQGILRNPNGIILVTGPTGSGKSTTLAAVLKSLNREDVNIITVEDPVENMIEGINQVSINSKIGLTFAACLRSILRQDPDIIMVGEMRDSETSQIAIRAAITGHLVVSTLHTNDAPSTISRLVDMGTESFMVGASVKGIIAQRLVRRLCPNCKQLHTVTKAEADLYEVEEGKQVYKPVGCTVCGNTGYKGRVAVHEILAIDSDLQDIVSSGKLTSEELRVECVKRGMRTLRDNALYNVEQGTTSLEEMLKIAYGQE